MIPYFSDNAVISQGAIAQLISESFLTVKGAALFLPRGNGSSTPRISHRRNKHADQDTKGSMRHLPEQNICATKIKPVV